MLSPSSPQQHLLYQQIIKNCISAESTSDYKQLFNYLILLVFVLYVCTHPIFVQTYFHELVADITAKYASPSAFFLIFYHQKYQHNKHFKGE